MCRARGHKGGGLTMTTAEDDVVPLDSLHNLHTLLDTRGDRLFAQDVIPLIRKYFDGLCVTPVHDGDDHRVRYFSLGGEVSPIPEDEVGRDGVGFS